MARHPVAPGKDIYNLLSKWGVFRVVLTGEYLDGQEIGEEDETLVLEDAEGTVRYELPRVDAIEDGENLIFEFFVRDRSKKYRCFFKNDEDVLEFDGLVEPMAEFEEEETEENEDTEDTDEYADVGDEEEENATADG